MSAVAKLSAKPAVSGIYNNFLDYIFSLKVPMFSPSFLYFSIYSLSMITRCRLVSAISSFNTIHRNE